MEKRTSNKIKSLLCNALDKMSDKTELNVQGLDEVFKLSEALKNMEKLERMEDYSGGEWTAQGRYNMGNSYRYVDDYDRYNDNMGRYSRGNYGRNGNAREDMLHELNEAISMASNDREREVIRKAIDSLKA